MSTASEIIARQQESKILWDRYQRVLEETVWAYFGVYCERVFFIMVADDLCGPWGRPMP